MSLEEMLGRLEDLRKARLASYITELLFGFLLGLGGLLTMILAGSDASLAAIWRYVAIGVGLAVFLFAASFFPLQAAHEKNRFDSEFFATLVPFLAPEDYRDFAYLKNPDLKTMASSLKTALASQAYPDMSSYYQGRLKGSTFFSFAYTYAKHDGKRHYESGGRYLEFTMPHPFPLELIMKDKRSPSYFKDAHLLVRLKSDSESFDAVHDVTSSREVEGLHFLSAKTVKALEDLNAEYGVHLNAHFHGNEVDVYFDDYVEHYMSSLVHPITKESYRSLEKEVLLPYEIYEALSLDSPFYSI
jgi:hypothetical protein